MAAPRCSNKVADIASVALFLGFIVLIALFGRFWPGILIALWAALFTRQFLMGRHFDLIFSTIVFGGLFLTFFLLVNWNAFLPFILSLGVLYIGYREYTA